MITALVRAVYSVAFCVLLFFAGLLLYALTAGAIHDPSYLEGTHWTHRVGAPLFIMAFLAPFAFFAALLVALILWLLDLKFRFRWLRVAGLISGAVIAAFLVAVIPFGPQTSDPGEPAFQKRFDRPLSAAQKRALYRFPDLSSCTARPGEPLLNWDRIKTTEEAEICAFRMLAQYDHVSDTRPWFEAQGFKLTDGFSPEKPSVDKYEKGGPLLRVSGFWSIKTKGPRFPTSGFIRRIVSAVPYGMNLNAAWSEDGTALRYVTIDFSTL